MLPRRCLSVLLTLLAVLAAGCGEGDGERLADDARARADEIREDARDLRSRAERLRDRLAERVRKTLDRLEKAIPSAGRLTRPPRRGDAGLEAFLTEVLRSVDAYWTTTLRASELDEPRVSYRWIAVGDNVLTGCRHVADDDAALYCPGDDTIYVGQAFAAGVLRGIRDDFPGQQAGQGRAIGDFGVAYIVAHEYGHNVQQELGFFGQGRRLAAKPFELQADCMAGSWGNSVYRAGKLKPGDVEEALSTAKAVGDFEYLSPQHHGTPDERREAWLRGYESGDPSVCQEYVGS
ncbi:MAG: neutral zinc metallopeptidase [Actinomycetota bacterium]|nr:neutral zinc metallopeptidase [Actinomycetota bacterium]